MAATHSPPYTAVVAFVIAAVVASAMPYATESTAVSVMVPAYFYPSGSRCGGSFGYWDCLIAAASAVPAVYDGGIIIVNPGDGPGQSFDSTYGMVINRTRQAADRVREATLRIRAAPGTTRTTYRWAETFGRRPMQMIGYVSTLYGARAVADVLADVDRYLVWYNVSGFFIDETATSSSFATAYNTIASGIRSRLPGAYIACNFGALPDSVAAASYMQACDVALYDEDYASNIQQIGSASWMANYNNSRFATLYHGAANSSLMKSMLEAIPTTQPRTGFTYITDDVMPNPWDRLPSYWASFLAQLSLPWARYGPSGSASMSSPAASHRAIEVRTVRAAPSAVAIEAMPPARSGTTSCTAPNAWLAMPHRKKASSAIAAWASQAAPAATRP